MLPVLVLSAVLAASDPCWVDDPGDPILACFDPGNRLALGASGALVNSSPGTEAALQLEGGVRIRRNRASRTHEHVNWSTEHLLLQTTYLRAPDASWQGELIGYDGLFERHLDEGFILLPTSHPTRLPFPFDVALTAQLVNLQRDPKGNVFLELGSAGFLLDVARDPSGERRLALGPSMAFSIERPVGVPAQILAQPLTGGTLLMRQESASGLWSAQLRVDAGWELALPRGNPGVRARGNAELERVLFAIDDAPVALRLSAAATRDPISGLNVRVGLGLIAAYDL